MTPGIIRTNNDKECYERDRSTHTGWEQAA